MQNNHFSYGYEAGLLLLICKITLNGPVPCVPSPSQTCGGWRFPIFQDTPSSGSLTNPPLGDPDCTPLHCFNLKGQGGWHLNYKSYAYSFYFYFKEDFIYLFLERGEGWEKGRETSTGHHPSPLHLPSWATPAILILKSRKQPWLVWLSGLRTGGRTETHWFDS